MRIYKDKIYFNDGSILGIKWICVAESIFQLVSQESNLQSFDFLLQQSFFQQFHLFKPQICCFSISFTSFFSLFVLLARAIISQNEFHASFLLPRFSCLLWIDERKGKKQQQMNVENLQTRCRVSMFRLNKYFEFLSAHGVDWLNRESRSWMNV